MAITSSYLVAVTRLGEMLEAVRNAQAPERFTTRFLNDLGFKETNDRLFVGVLKALGFLDQNGTPQQRYYDFLDANESKRVLADGIRDAYEDLFRVKKDAHTLSREPIKNKIKSLTQGQFSESVLGNMAKTFVELVKFADFDAATSNSAVAKADSEVVANPVGDVTAADSKEAEPSIERGERLTGTSRSHGHRIDALSYRIEIVLPATRDRAVYDAIFRSLKDHLL